MADYRDETRQESDAATGSEPTRFGRRRMLQSTAAGTAALLGGVSLGSAAATASGGSPLQNRDWTLALDEQFEGDSLDEDRWGVGFGWGMDCDGDDAAVSEDNVVVDDGALRLRITHGGDGASDVYQGAINSKDRQTFGPGHYFEAEMKLPGRPGLLPAFWAKPNSETWPPELDFIELFQEGEGDRRRAHYNVHYTTSTRAGDEGSHTQSPITHDATVDLTETSNVYGCAWLEDGISFYFNGEHVGTCDGADALATTSAAAPFYLMFSNHVNRIGTADLSQAWEEETVVDWCRVWEAE